LCNGLIAVTPGIRRLMLQKGVPDEKIKLVTNGVEDELYEQLPESEDTRHRWSIPAKTVVVFFSGTLSTFSNVGLLLEAAALLKDKINIRFIIAGEGQMRTKYEEFCSLRKLQNVCFIGARPRNEIPGLCVMADLCVHMFKEGPFWDIFFSNKMFDYMGAGRPVVYSGGGDSAALIKQSDGGLVVESENPAALAEGILKLASNPEMRKQMGQRARTYVLTHYSRQLLLAKLEGYLNDIAWDRTLVQKEIYN
jgi:glycosyltransferase involved in cell wall biosynthesis